MVRIRSTISVPNRHGSVHPSGLASPEEGEQVAMPAEEGVGLNQMEGVAPRGRHVGQQHQEESVLSVEARPGRGPPPEHDDLLAEQRVLGHQFRARANGVAGGGARERGRGTKQVGAGS